MSDQQDKADNDRVDSALTSLMMTFDSAMVFVCRHEGDGTVAIVRGRGNAFSRYGLVAAWMDGTLTEVDKEEDE